MANLKYDLQDNTMSKVKANPNWNPQDPTAEQETVKQQQVYAHKVNKTMESASKFSGFNHYDKLKIPESCN